MQMLNRFRLAHRMFLCFGIVLMLSLGASGLALVKLAEVEESLDDVVGDNNVKIKLNTDMARAIHVVTREMRTAALLTDAQAKAERRKNIAAARTEYDQARAALDKMPPDDGAKAARAAIDAAAAKARPLNNQVLDRDQAGKETEALALLLAQAGPATEAWVTAVENNIHLQEQNTTKAYDAAREAYAAARALLIGFGLFNVVMAVVLALLLVRSVVKQLGGEPGEVASLATTIANADLSSTVAVRAGDTGSVMAAMARMQNALTGIVASVRSNADGVATASAQIAQGNQDLSGRTEQQASALQQTAATMEQLGSTVRSNADSAKQANQLAQGASNVAAQGGEVVGQVVETMRGINDSSRKIADIITVIDGIAFQTNILALNAAVEAARAGEQGRGFAVVAGEVRTLAQRSADAAKEIKSLITASVERVEHGTTLVDQAGKTMNDIVTAIHRVTDIVGEITSASVEQSSGVGQVGEAITQMDQATQQNAALVEESAAAAESLRLQAQRLVQTVAVFKLASGSGSAAAAG